MVIFHLLISDLRHCSPWLHFLAVVAIGNFIAVLAEIVMIVNYVVSACGTGECDGNLGNNYNHGAKKAEEKMALVRNSLKAGLPIETISIRLSSDL